MKLSIIWMFLISLVGFAVKRDHSLYQGHVRMCEKIRSDFVERMEPYEFEQCKRLYKSALTFKEWEKHTNSWLSTWGWSHLAVYSPSESNEIWSSRSQSIGVKLKNLEGVNYVYRAHPDSVFQKGDVILKVNGKLNPSHSDILYSGGDYTIERKGEKMSLEAQVKDYVWNDGVEVDVNRIVIPSFRGEFFNEKAMVDFINKVNSIKSSKIYIDLRDNYGGNIAAGLRFLSVFLCEEKVIGEFKVPSREGLGESTYPLSVRQSVQVAHLKKFSRVYLKVPKIESCVKNKKIYILVNSSTSSTAELVAQAFIDTGRGVVLGEQTSGRMVLSSWDQVPQFPDGFYFSYPYALYKSISGAEIEKEGVLPDVYKTYSLDLERMGKDSFIN